MTLAHFNAVVLALAKSVATQSVTVALQVLHRPRISFRRLLMAMRLELSTGVLESLGCGLFEGITILLKQHHYFFVTMIATGDVIRGVSCAACIGWVVPTALRLLSLGPQVAADPIALAGADMVTIIIYFSLARLLIT